MRDFHVPGRSPVYATNGLAATSHPLATASALEMLRSGGNAIDAVVAASAVLSVVEPQSTGIGGDCFALFAPAGREIIAYNGSGRSPKAVDVDWYLERGITRIPGESAHAVTVPGAVEAWSRLIDDHGKLELARVLQPAIAAARNGFPVQQRIGWDWARQSKRLVGDASAAKAYLPGGSAPSVGAIHRFPQLATTLERIAAFGPQEFYQGRVAEDIVEHLIRHGGLHSIDDFATHMGEYVAPVSADYHGIEIYECPPNGQGIVALLMLKVLAGFELSNMDPAGADRFHLEIEVARLAKANRDLYVADPNQAEVPTEMLLSKTYVDCMRERISFKHALHDSSVPPMLSNRSTVYSCVVDGDGNAVSLINSIFEYFGSGICSPNSGVLLHSRGSGFVVDPGHPNCIAPSKRPLHTIIPAMAAQNGQPIMPFGVVGGDYQPLGQVHVLTNMVDYEMDVQEAIDFPRVLHDKGILWVEHGIGGEVVDALLLKGHDVRIADEPCGGAQAIYVDRDRGVLVGGSDPRLDGCALGY